MKQLLLSVTCVSLFTILIAGSCSRGSSDPEPPAAKFSYTSTRALPAVVTFTNTSTTPSGGPAVYKWDFGDGTPAVMGADQIHTYNTAGTYQVKLIQIPAGAPNDTLVRVLTISTMGPSGSAGRIGNNYGASFNYSVAYSNYTVIFTNTSNNAASTYLWDFGDGSQASTNATTVPHQYAGAGNYYVVLAATNSLGTDTTGTMITLQ